MLLCHVGYVAHTAITMVTPLIGNAHQPQTIAYFTEQLVKCGEKEVLRTSPNSKVNSSIMYQYCIWQTAIKCNKTASRLVPERRA